MTQKIQQSVQWIFPVIIGACLLSLFVLVKPASAQLTPITPPDPKPGSFGIEATKKQDPPTQGATISTPGNGSSFTTSPITVSGICPKGLLIQVYNNGVMVGAVMCEAGSFSIQVSLFAGVNELSVAVYDDLDQIGPASNIVTVNYTDVRFTSFGELITLTSSYGRRATPAGNGLSWPLQLSGGTGPYAFSISWGDGSEAELKSQSLAGLVTIGHTYKNAGIYQANVTVTDVNGVSAFLQLIAVSSGVVDTTQQTETEAGGTVRTEILWIPVIVAVVLLIPAYWLGRRSQLVTLRNKMLKERELYKEK